MLPHKGASFFGVTTVAEFVDGVAFHHLGPETAVMVMAVRAFHSPFPDRVMGLLVFLGADCAVADVAELGLKGLEVFPGHGVNGMAVVAGNSHRSMLGHIPEGQVSGLAMAGETAVRFFLGIGDFFAEDEDAHAFFTAFFHVGASGPMAGFTGISVDRAIGELFVAVNRLSVTVVVILVATLADLGAHNAVASPYLPSGKDSAEQNENG
jgi:hypothetical protein